MVSNTKRGRPRSEKSRAAVLGAAHELLREGGGGALSIEAVARRAGVGKPTIYRWWPSLADIVLEALLEQAEADIPVPEGGALQDSLRQFLRLSMQSIEGGAGTHLRFLMAQAQKDERFRERFREGFVGKRRAVLRSILRLAVDQGQVEAGWNVDLAVDMVFGAMWYRLLIGHLPMDESFADELAEAVMATSRPG